MLLNLYFFDYFLIIPFIIIFIFFWSFFIKNNFFFVRLNPSSKDLLTNSKFLKKVHYLFFLNWNLVNYFYFFIFFILFKYDCNVFWFNHLKINNFLINLNIVILFFSLAVIFFIKFVKNSNINYNIDYFSSIFNLIIFIPLMFLSNTLYTFLFLLELNSLLILYKFSVSRNWFPKNKFLINKNNSDRNLPKAYLNMIFFQYWANFFSSMLLMFSIFNVIYIFGSSEWVFLNFISQKISYNFNFFYFVFLWISFFIGLFLKIGLTPIHLFKIEVYKGIPFISVFFYTTLYFLSFFLFFITIVLYHLNSFKVYWNLLFLLFIIFGFVYSLILLFDVNLLKSFFAYSTVVNVLAFIIVIYINFN